MSAVPQLGRETEFAALGQTWKTGRWTLAAWGELLQLAKPHLPDPYDGLATLLAGMDRKLAREVVMDAQKSKRRIVSIGSPEVQQWLQTIEGQMALLYVLLKVNHPEVTPDLAMQIAMEIGAEKQSEMTEAAAGQPPPAKNA